MQWGFLGVCCVKNMCIEMSIVGAASMREFNQLYTRKLADLSTEDPIDFFLVKQ